MKRTDVHKPSNIDPKDYEFVGQECFKIEGLGDCAYVLQERLKIKEHMDRTGGTYSSHEHGGNCMVCGSVNATYTVLFYHSKTNTYVRMGTDCATKCDMGNEADFRSFRTGIKNALEFKAGKEKAKAILEKEGLSKAWSLYSDMMMISGSWDGIPKEEQTVTDMVGNLVKYGNFSDKQVSYLKVLLNRIDTRPVREAKIQAERAAAKDCPSGRVGISGVVLSVKMQETDFGSIQKMTVKAEDGFVVYGTVPSSLGILTVGNDQRLLQYGDLIRFVATVTPSDKDTKFGFFKRPTNAELVQGRS